MNRELQRLANKADEILDQLVQINLDVSNLLGIHENMSKLELIDIAQKHLQPEGLTMLREYVYRLAFAKDDENLRRTFATTMEANLKRELHKRPKT